MANPSSTTNSFPVLYPRLGDSESLLLHACCRGLNHHLNQSFRRRRKEGRPAFTAFVKGQNGRSKFCDHVIASKSKLTKLFSFLACFIIKESGGRKAFLLDIESKYLQNDFV